MKEKKKAITAACLAAGVLGISLASCLGPLVPQKTPVYIDGTYSGIGEGMMGDISVEVVVKEGKLSSVTLKEHKETDGVYQKAEKAVIANILQQQSVQVDGVSGATETSDGIKEAVEDALSKAKEK